MPTFQQSKYTSHGNTSSPSFTLDSAPLENDVIYIGFTAAVNATTITTPSGWTNLLGGNNRVDSGSHSSFVFAHAVTSAEAGSSQVTWTFTSMNSGTFIASGAVVYRSVDTANLFLDAPTPYSDSTSLATSTIPSTTPSVTGGLFVAFHSMDASVGPGSGVSGYTRRVVNSGNGGMSFYENNTATVVGVGQGGDTITSDSDQHIVFSWVIPNIALPITASGSTTTSGTSAISLVSIVPRNLIATTVDDDSIELDWDAVAGATRYIVERDDSPWVVIADNVLTNTYTDTGLDPSTEYTYRVRSVTLNI